MAELEAAEVRAPAAELEAAAEVVVGVAAEQGDPEAVAAPRDRATAPSDSAAAGTHQGLHTRLTQRTLVRKAEEAAVASGKAGPPADPVWGVLRRVVARALLGCPSARPPKALPDQKRRTRTARADGSGSASSRSSS